MNRAKKKGFRRYLPFLLLTAVLGIAVAFVLLLPTIQEKFPADKQISSTPISAIDQIIAEQDEQALRSITVSHLDGDAYTLLYQDGILFLTLADGSTEPIEESLTEDLIKYSTNIFAEEIVVEDENDYLENLPDMGLQPPQIEVVSTYADGSTVTISFGYAFSTSSLYYYRWSGDNHIYLCYAGIYETFEYTADMLLTINQPSITPALIERVSIIPDGKEPIVCTFTTGVGNTIYGTLQSPFIYPMEQTAADSLLSAIDNFRLGARLETATAETRAAYGLNTPQVVVKIAQREGVYSLTDADGILQTYPLSASTYTLSIGNKGGEYFYICELDGIFYRVSSFLLTAFLHADAMDYISLHPANLGDDTLQGVLLQTGSGTLDFRVAYTENVLPNNELETDENGNIVYTTKATVNGNTISSDAFTELISRLQQMAVSDQLETISEPDGTPLWQLTLTTVRGNTRTLAAYAMDSFSDILAVDGVALHYISNEALEIALGEFSALLSPAGSNPE